jgi:hypothetical protein
MATDSQDENFIERCPHDEENPYTQILNSLIRDINLSPQCRWLLIYLLSNKRDWKISIQQIINHLKDHKGYARDSIYLIINEAIEAGYMKREQDNKGKFGKVKYFISERPKFKKCLPQTGFSDTGLSDTHPSNTTETEHKKEHVLKKEQEIKTTTTDAVVVPSNQESLRLLKEIGFDAKTAEILSIFPIDRIERQYVALKITQELREVDNPLGWLRNAIENDWKAPEPKRNVEQEEANRRLDEAKDRALVKAECKKLYDEHEHKFTTNKYFDIGNDILSLKAGDKYYGLPYDNACVRTLKRFIEMEIL